MDVREIPASATYDLRSRILRPGQPLDESRYAGDEIGVHFGFFEGNLLLSTVSAYPEDNPRFPSTGHWRIRGMATEESYQNRGLGLQVLLALLSWARARGIPLFWCNARQRAISFYERQGFRVVSEPFELPGIGSHCVMRIDL